MQAGMERSFEDSRRKVIQQDLFKGKLKPDDVKKMGYTDDQVREIVSGKKLLPGESWDDFSGAGFPKVKILGKGELSDDEVNRIATERKKQGEAEKSAQELYLRAVEERKSAEHDQARARIEDSMKIIETTQSETQAAKESLNVVLLSMQERRLASTRLRTKRSGRSSSGPRTPTTRAAPFGTSSSTLPPSRQSTRPPRKNSRRST